MKVNEYKITVLTVLVVSYSRWIQTQTVFGELTSKTTICCYRLIRTAGKVTLANDDYISNDFKK